MPVRLTLPPRLSPGNGPFRLSPEARDRLGQRATSMLLVLAIHALLGLLILSLAPPVLRKKVVAMVTFNIENPAPKAVTTDTETATQPEQSPQPQVTPPKPTPPVQPVIEIPPEIVQAVELAPPPPIPQPAPPVLATPQPPVPPKRVYGPPAPARTAPGGDSERVEGTGPNGEPLYAASWYREPYPDELRGFLSTAQGPGWGLIACRTAPNYRVEDCIIVGEYPPGSRIARSVQAAAWQFRVRPPQIGGKPQVGEWVRIRIDYELRRQP